MSLFYGPVSIFTLSHLSSLSRITVLDTSRLFYQAYNYPLVYGHTHTFSSLKSFKALTLQETPGPAAIEINSQVHAGGQGEALHPSVIYKEERTFTVNLIHTLSLKMALARGNSKCIVIF